MAKYKVKLKHILPTFFFVSIFIITGFLLIRWVLTVQFNLIDIKEEYWEIWIPMVIPWLPIYIWLRPKFKILTFKRDNDNGRSFFTFISGFTIAATVIISQNYFSTATGKLQLINDISEFESIEDSRYYKISKFMVIRDKGGIFTDFRTSGNRNENLDINIYFVAPIYLVNIDPEKQIVKYWAGLEEHKQINNEQEDEIIENQYQEFYKETITKINEYDYYSLDHFEKIPTSDEKMNYLKAIESIKGITVNDTYVILTPIFESYESRNGNKFEWIFGSFSIGLFIILFSMIWPDIDNKELKSQLKGINFSNKDDYEFLQFVIPKGKHFISAIILDLNILVFFAMVFQGVHIISPTVDELLPWGVNNRTITSSGEWWRLFASMFLHGGIMHLFLNIYGLILAAIFLEPVISRYNFLFIYILSGLCGSLASIWWYENIFSVGASGAIFGLYGALLGLLLINAFPKEGKNLLFSLLGPYVLINLIWGLTGGIDNAAHVGGLLSGALISIFLYKLNYIGDISERIEKDYIENPDNT